MKKLRIYLMLAIIGLLASCGTQKKLTTTAVIPPPQGVEVMDTTTSVFTSVKLPKNDKWQLSNKKATATSNEFLTMKMDGWKNLSLIRALGWGYWKSDLNDTVAALSSIKSHAKYLITYNDFHFKFDGNFNKVKKPEFTMELTTLDNGTRVVLVEAEIKITKEGHKEFGNSHYSRNYYFLAKKDEEKATYPIIGSTILLTQENYEVEKAKFKELVNYIANTAVLNTEYKILK